MITLVESAPHFWILLGSTVVLAIVSNMLQSQKWIGHAAFIICHHALILLFYQEFHGQTHQCQTLNLLFCRRKWFALLVKASVLPLETAKLFVPVRNILKLFILYDELPNPLSGIISRINTSISSSINLSINGFVRHSLLNDLHPFLIRLDESNCLFPFSKRFTGPAFFYPCILIPY